MPVETGIIFQVRDAESSARSDLLTTIIGLAPGGMGVRQIPLDPAGFQVRTGGGDNENRIDVCRDHLGNTFLSRSSAREHGRSQEDVRNR